MYLPYRQNPSSIMGFPARRVELDTGSWHYIDIPLGISNGDLRKYCPSTGCVTSAIAVQFAMLRKPEASPQEKADALRYVIHFVGDLHQPLHTTTNNDLGGNCLPVEFEGRAPAETNAESGAYRPNLHGVWDTDIIEEFSRGETPQQLADALENKFKTQMTAWKLEPVDIDAWVWQSHRVAQAIVYGDLPTKVPVEQPEEVKSCSADNHVSNRLLSLHEQLGSSYETTAEAAIQEQLTKAGIRLAELLNSLWP